LRLPGRRFRLRGLRFLRGGRGLGGLRLFRGRRRRRGRLGLPGHAEQAGDELAAGAQVELFDGLEVQRPDGAEDGLQRALLGREVALADGLLQRGQLADDAVGRAAAAFTAPVPVAAPAAPVPISTAPALAPAAAPLSAAAARRTATATILFT